METNMIRSLDGGAFQDPVVIDPDTGSNVLSDAAKRPTDFIIGTDFAATLSRSVTLAAYRMGYAVSTRPPPTTTAVAAAFASYAQSGLALSMSFQRSASGGTAATANPRDPRENATISGQVLVNSTTGSTTGATLAANELWAQLMLLGSGTPEYYQSGDALITDRYGALLTPAYVVGPALDGTQPFLAPVSGLNHALAAFDTHYTGSALARNIGAALFRADSHAFRTPMWLTDKSHPMLQGVELNTDVGKRLAEISVRATIHVAIGIYSRQLTRLALEIWDPLVRTLSSAPAMEIADADALKRWDSIIGAYRKYVPLHPALGLLPPGRPRVDAPEGSGAAFVVPAADANTVADLFDNAHRMPGTVSPAMTFIWNVVPGLRFLRGEAGHNPTNPVDISLSQIATDALALEMIERESPGLMAYAAA